MSSSDLPEPPSKAPVTSKHVGASVTSSTASSAKQSRIPAKPHHPVDARLERLSEEVLPHSPYLLRMRARYAQYHARDRYYWRKDTQFDEDEEELQYLTFRQNHDDTILHAHGQWDDGNGGIATKELPSSQASSGRTPVATQVAKKKISLAEYQKLDKSKPRPSDIDATAAKDPIEAKSHDTKEAPKKEAEKGAGEAKGAADSNPKAIKPREEAAAPVRKRYVLYPEESLSVAYNLLLTDRLTP